MVTVSVTGTEVLEVSAAEPWLRAQATPVGEPTTLHPRFTVPLNPLVGVTNNATFAVELGATETSDVAEVSEKSDSGLFNALLKVYDDGA